MATLQPGEKARMFALGGLARGGATRGGYVDNRMYISIDGDQVGWARDDQAVGTLLGTLTITDALDEVPNTCSCRINGAVPPEGAEIRITQGTINRVGASFAGYALTVQQRYALVPQNVQADVRAIDYTWLLSFVKVTGQYRQLSGTAIAQDLIARFAAVNGFTAYAVVPGLPMVDEITYTNEELPDALTRLCRRIGAYWYVDYQKRVHLYIEPEDNGPPVPLTPAHPTLSAVTRTRERTQGLTRVLVEARGSRLLAAVADGETILPLESVASFAALPDVFLKVSFSGADGALHLDFSGVVPSAGGSLVGPGIQPSSAPGLAPATGTPGLEAGVHQYAYTYATAAGETKPSPIGSIDTATPVPPATVAPTVTQDPPANFSGSSVGSNYNIGSAFAFAYAYNKATIAGDLSMLGALSPASPALVAISNGDALNPSMSAVMQIRIPMSADPAVTWINVYTSENGGPFRNALNTPNVPGGGTAALSTNGANEPGAGGIIHPGPATAATRVQVSAIAIGPAGTTARKLYRSKAGQAALLLVATLADNLTLTYLDQVADAALGAAAPTGDTSGLKQAEGTINPGATAILVAAPAVFRAAGGWAVVAEQAIRYTGVSATSLTGIPATGPGAVVGPIQYNTAIRAAPLLTGIPSASGAGATRYLPIALSAGDEVYPVVQVDDLARQQQLAADLKVTSGVREEWIQDRRLSIPEARARGLATLAARPLTAATLEYTVRDLRTAAGKTITVNLPAPTNMSGALKIQRVIWSNFRPKADQLPTARVTASSARFSFEDWLRIVRTKD